MDMTSPGSISFATSLKFIQLVAYETINSWMLMWNEAIINLIGKKLSHNSFFVFFRWWVKQISVALIGLASHRRHMSNHLAGTQLLRKRRVRIQLAVTVSIRKNALSAFSSFVCAHFFVRSPSHGARTCVCRDKQCAFSYNCLKTCMNCEQREENTIKCEIGIVFDVSVSFHFCRPQTRSRKTRKIIIIKSSDNNNDIVMPPSPPRLPSQALAKQFDNSYTSVFMA